MSSGPAAGEILVFQYPQSPGIWSFCPDLGHVPKEMEYNGCSYLGPQPIEMELGSRVTLSLEERRVPHREMGVLLAEKGGGLQGRQGFHICMAIDG